MYCVHHAFFVGGGSGDWAMNSRLRCQEIEGGTVVQLVLTHGKCLRYFSISGAPFLHKRKNSTLSFAQKKKNVSWRKRKNLIESDLNTLLLL